MKKTILTTIMTLSFAAMSHALTVSYTSATAGGWDNNKFQTYDLPTTNDVSWRTLSNTDTNGYGQTFNVSETFNVEKIRVYSIRHYATNAVTVKLWKNIISRPDSELSDTNNLVASFEFSGTALNTGGAAGDVLELVLDESEKFELSPLASSSYYLQIAAKNDGTNSVSLLLLNHTDVNAYTDGGYAVPGGAVASMRDLGIAFVSDDTPGFSELNPVADTEIRYGANMGINYGGSEQLTTRQNDVAPRDFVAYIRFDLSSISGSITDATLAMTRAGGDSLAAERVRFLGLDNVAGNTAQDWDEDTLTWNTAGAEINTNIYPDPVVGSSPFHISSRVTDFESGTSNIVETVTDTKAAISGTALAEWLEARRKDGGMATLIVEFPAFGPQDEPDDKSVAYWSRNATNEAAVAPLLSIQWDTNIVLQTYDVWIEGYPGVGSLTNRTDDADLDGRNNMDEYAFGGNPTVQDSAYEVSSSADSSWIYYVYPRRADAANVGLTYTVQLTSDLVHSSWSGATEGVDYQELDETAWPGNIDFMAVSNRIPVTADAEFIRVEASD